MSAFGSPVARRVPPVPASPEMKQARCRLGTLLTGMKRTDDPLLEASDLLCDETLASVGGSPLRLGGGGSLLHSPSTSAQSTPTKTARRHPRRVLYELRLKPFELSDRGRDQSLYALARLWVRGREDLVPQTQSGQNSSGEVDSELCGRADMSLDLLATKEITTLPGKDAVESDLDTDNVTDFDAPKIELEQTTGDEGPAILSHYVHHWKAVKKQFVWGAVRQSSVRARPYARSTKLLQIVHDIAQANRPT